MNSAYKNILKATTLFGSVQGLSILINLVRTKLVAEILGPAGVGLNSIYNETRELLHSTTNMGMDVSIIRELSAAHESHDDKRLAELISLTRSWVILLSILGMFVCVVFANPLSLITFSDSEHTFGYVMLSPAVAFSTLTCGELAILKGTRHLKGLATISVLHVIAGTLITIPIYYIWRMEGIIMALVLLSIAMYVIAIIYSFRIYPLKTCFKPTALRAGIPMLLIGLSFVLAGIVSHGSELAIRTYLNKVASLETVGLYAAGFTMVMSYGGIIFASVENDYYPRLSGIFTDKEKRQQVMCKQMEVFQMLSIPLAIVMILLLPVAVPLLLSSRFNEVVPMTQIASLALLFRGVYLPAIYLPLSAGDSKSFFFLEAISYGIVVASVILGYMYYGLAGTGVALVVANFMDVVFTLTFVRFRYDARVSNKVLALLLVSICFAVAYIAYML